MNKNIFTFLLLFVSVITFSQNLCDDAYQINSIPFFESGINTVDADADTSGNYCGASGIAANDTIFEYTPTSDVNIDIILSNVQIDYDFLILMFIYDECPDVAGATCMQSATGGNLVVSDVALTAGNTYYIVITNTNALSVNHFTFDLQVREHYQKDVEMTYFTQPHSTCHLMSPWQEISADIKNIGNDTVFGYKMRYNINGVIDSLDYTDDTLVPGQHKTIFYYTDLSIEYEYLVKVFIDYPLDQNPENDTIGVLVHNLGDVNTYPYLEDFEVSSAWIGEWSKFVYDYPFSTKEETSWQWGVPTASVIDTAASGNKAIVSNLTGNCLEYERSVLMSPCFDFSSLSIPVIEFDMWKKLDTITAVYLEYTTNIGGTWTWTRIGSTGSGTNWYNEYQGYDNDTWLGNSEGWIKAKHRMENLAGEPMVIFRFVIENPSLVTSEGFAIDNIHIFEAPNHDIGVAQILSPQSACGLSQDSIKIVIWNYSPDSSHTNFDVRYLINGTEVVETVNDILNANDSLIYTFNTTYDFSNIAEYKIFAETMLTDDDDTLNDADSVNIINYSAVSILPYFNDFEIDNGNFFAVGENSSWQWGEPTDSVINTAYSGTKIWATNLSGYHNDPENTYLTSSCFDLSNMKRPYLKFKTWYDLYFLDGLTSSYVQVETSIDEGETWSVLGTSADANWYKVGSAWTGTIDNWEEMSHSLTIEPNIKFRFKLWALEAKTGIAIDDFEICDAPIAGYEYVASAKQVSFTDTSINATSYQWLFNDGQSSNLQNPVMDFNQDTIIATLITTNDCFTDTAQQTIYTVGIKQLSDSDIKVFPNPVKDNLNIVLDKQYGELYIQLTDINSKIIYSKKIENNKTDNTISINLTNFDSGMYFLKITTNNGELVKKILCK